MLGGHHIYNMNQLAFFYHRKKILPSASECKHHDSSSTAERTSLAIVIARSDAHSDDFCETEQILIGSVLPKRSWRSCSNRTVLMWSCRCFKAFAVMDGVMKFSAPIRQIESSPSNLWYFSMPHPGANMTVLMAIQYWRRISFVSSLESHTESLYPMTMFSTTFIWENSSKTTVLCWKPWCGKSTMRSVFIFSNSGNNSAWDSEIEWVWQLR